MATATHLRERSTIWLQISREKQLSAPGGPEPLCRPLQDHLSRRYPLYLGQCSERLQLGSVWQPVVILLVLAPVSQLLQTHPKLSQTGQLLTRRDNDCFDTVSCAVHSADHHQIVGHAEAFNRRAGTIGFGRIAKALLVVASRSVCKMQRHVRVAQDRLALRPPYIPSQMLSRRPCLHRETASYWR
jgi:hypothetical protein